MPSGFFNKVGGRLSLFSSFKEVLISTPPFSKSSLNLAQFNGRFIEICKHLLSVIRLKVCVTPNNLLRFITSSGLEYCIDPKIKGIFSRKSLYNGDEKLVAFILRKSALLYAISALIENIY